MLGEVQKLCGRVAILREGRLVDIQSMKQLRESGYKKITLTAKAPIPEDFFDIPGAANVQQEYRAVSLMFNGSVASIMDRLCRLELEDILIEEPSLEEIFLHYYA